MRGLVAFLALLAPGTSALAQSCGCDRVVPFSGAYRVDFPEKVTVPGLDFLDISSSDLDPMAGAKVRVAGDGATANLTCEGLGYKGVIDMMSQPTDLWAEPTDGLVGLRMGENFKMQVLRPAAVAGAVLEPMLPLMDLTMVGGFRKATPLMCERAKFTALVWNLMMDIHSDIVLEREALEGRLAAYNTKKPSWAGADGSGAYDSIATTTFQEIVDGELTYRMTELELSASDGSQLVSSVAAYLTPETCKITPPTAFASSGRCRLAIEIEAMMAHEASHRETCRFMAELTDKQETYSLWINNPANLNTDEVDAYRAGLAVLEPWIEERC